jgi:hypothetical protein
MNIKALEARAQALAAAQSKQEIPASMPSPWQGASHVFNQAADAFATKRADQAAEQQRQQLGALMGQIGPEGPNPQQLAGITTRDTDLGKMYASQAFEARQSAASRQAQKELAAQKAAQDEAAAESQEKRLMARPPNDDLINLKRGLQQGIITQQEYDARVKKLNAPPAAEQKAANEAEDQHIELQTNLAGLKEGLGLLQSGKVYSGGGAEVKEFMGKNLPTVGGYVAGTDPESTKATQRYNQIVGPQVLDLLSKLKGASSDRDMKWAIDNLNDKSADVETKKKALSMLIAKVDAHARASESRLRASGREPPKVDIPPASETSATVVAPASAAGGGVQGVASEAEALKLPPGTKFKLPDGRTGTAR